MRKTKFCSVVSVSDTDLCQSHLSLENMGSAHIMDIRKVYLGNI